MDPALREIIRSGETHEDIEAIIRLNDAAVFPENIRIITRFGNIATCRLARNRIKAVWGDESVASLKAPRNFGIEPEPEAVAHNNEIVENLIYERTPQTNVTGKDVVVGIIDWGFDVTHPNFTDNSGNSRFLSLWDQSSETNQGIAKYGYGTVYSRERINEALQSDAPFSSLGYHPAKGDPLNNGSHGTHVLDIAAGNGTYGQRGVAPEADIVAVHLSSGNVKGLASLGDSVRILEAIDFIAETAGDRPLVINMSVGKHGGSHSGKSLVEQGMDAFLREKPGRAIVQSTGNYYLSDTHSSGRVGPGSSKTFVWKVHKADKTPNELEVWYPGMDTFGIELLHPDTGLSFSAGLNENTDIVYNNELVGRLYHRIKEPNTLNNHIDIFLYPNAPYGAWEVTLKGQDVVDGKYHAWIERDAACMGCQSKFDAIDADSRHTTGTICNGLYTIAVGAINPYAADDMELAPFSSSGPTTDFRQKPNLIAPGLYIEAARSASKDESISSGELTIKSGTSMAAPHVTGAVALLFEAAGELLPIEKTRNYLLGNTSPVNNYEENRVGNGILNIERMLSDVNKKAISTAETGTYKEATAYSFNVSGDVVAVSENEDTTAQSDIAEPLAHENTSVDAAIAESSDYEDTPADISTTEYPVQEDNFVDINDGEISDDSVDTDFDEFFTHQNTYIDIESAPHKISIPKTYKMTTSEIYEFFKQGNYVGFENHGYEIIALPGEKITMPLQEGDTLLRVAFGEGLAFQSSLVSGELTPQFNLYTQNIAKEKNKTGHYAEVVETPGNMEHNRLARRVTDENAYLPRNQMIVRPKEVPDEARSLFMQSGEQTGTTSVWLQQIAARRHKFENVMEEMQVLYKSGLPEEIGAEVLPPPRPCCILASTISPFTSNSNLVNPSNLGNHGVFSGSNSEKKGLIYCGRAGFVDLGHLRETCDLTKHAYDAIVSANGSPASINTLHGRAVFHATPLPRLWLSLAMKIAYTDALGYEIITYTNNHPGGHNSSFSPEDLCSNYLGVELARRAIVAGGNFNAAVTRELQSLLTSLSAQTVAETAKAFNLINGRWVNFSGVSSLLNNNYLRRRNFSRTPWKAGHSSDAPTPSWVTSPLTSRAPYIYVYTNTYGRSIPDSRFAVEISSIHRRARSTYGPNYNRP